MKFARLIQQYKYDLSSTWDKYGNIGDCIQNIAVENLYKEFGIKEKDILLINRDEIHEYTGEEAVLLMQGWFGNVHNVFSLKIPPKIKPLYIGFHLNDYNSCRQRFLDENLPQCMKEFQPIGCRDRNTRYFLASCGLDTYFSGCLTLTYPKRKKLETQKKIFIVDVTEEVEKIIPDKIKAKADRSISHKYSYKELPVTYEETLDFEKKAREILERYQKEAKLVITSKIHCAMPCVAMGIPVVFIHEQADNIRFDVLNGIIPRYSIKSKNWINWNPKPVDIEDLKQVIKQNVFYRLEQYSKKYSIVVNRNEQNYENVSDKLNRITEKYNKRYIIKNYFDFFETINNELMMFFIYLKLQFCGKKSVILWGASKYLEEIMKRYPLLNKNIKGIIDNNKFIQGSYMGKYKVYSPDAIKNLNPVKIIVTIKNNNKLRVEEIKKYLKEQSLENIDVISMY